MRYTVRPISDRTWLGSTGKKSTTFRASWGSTIKLLGLEVEALDGTDVVIECDVREQDIRIDGGLRADARPDTPAVVVAFESKHGPLLYRCDRFFGSWSHQAPDWQHNVRAIALTLEALRAVDRYGATETGQQYAGFKALPAGRAMPAASHMTSTEAYGVLSKLSGVQITPGESEQSTRARLRSARATAHPDRNDGDRALWDRVEQAAAVLRLT